MNTPYKNVRHALTSAYVMCSRDVVKLSSTFRDLTGSSVRCPSYWDTLDRWDQLAQASMVISVARSTFGSGLGTALLDMAYMIPVDQRADDLRDGAMQIVSEFLKTRMTVDRWFLLDVCRDYAGGRQYHTQQWWSDHLGKSRTTLWRQTRKAKTLLDDELEKVDNVLSTKFNNYGLIP